MLRNRRIDRLGDESGLSLIEVVIASTLSAFILLFVLSMLDNGTKNERAAQARHDTTLQLRQAMTQVTKDLRQATAVGTASNTSLLDMQTLLGGVGTRVRYDISGTDFRRTICANLDLAVSCGGTPAILASHMASTTPFCYDPPNCVATAPVTTPPSMRITLSATPEVFSGGAIVLSTDIELRNSGL